MVNIEGLGKVQDLGDIGGKKRIDEKKKTDSNEFLDLMQKASGKKKTESSGNKKMLHSNGKIKVPVGAHVVSAAEALDDENTLENPSKKLIEDKSISGNMPEINEADLSVDAKKKGPNIDGKKLVDIEKLKQETDRRRLGIA